ncbi:MAG: hypothetical protein M0P66_10750 [Salinivirgaceae bacterium]|nr:hypothetical protein [Salinivirgaceae bacterium]
MEIESRVGQVMASQKYVFQLLSDFNNIAKFIPNEQVSDFVSDADSCSFTINNIGKFGMRIIEREPSKLLKIVNDYHVPFSFNMWIQLKDVDTKDTRVKITLRAELNPLLKVVAQKPLTSFVEALVTKMETIRE